MNWYIYQGQIQQFIQGGLWSPISINGQRQVKLKGVPGKILTLRSWSCVISNIFFLIFAEISILPVYKEYRWAEKSMCVPVSSIAAQNAMADPIAIKAYTLLTKGNTTIVTTIPNDAPPSTKYLLYLSNNQPPTMVPTKKPIARAVNT